jgi:hypothetical protein
MPEEDSRPKGGLSIDKIVAAILIPTAFIGFIAYRTCVPGDAIGKIDVSKEGGVLAVEGARGAVLRFLLDIEPAPKSVERKLEKSVVSVELDGGDKTHCAAWAGAVHSSGRWGMSGIVLDCRLELRASGNANLKAKVAWAPGYAPERAVLEVRRSDP